MKKSLITNNTKSSKLELPSQSKKVRDFFHNASHRYTPDSILERFAEMMDKRKFYSESNKASLEFIETSNQVLYALGLNTHVPVAESVEPEYRHFITEMIYRTEQEYGCKTAIEKSLAEVIALSHVRILCLSKTISLYASGKVGINREINDYYRIISKELDRANRQLISSILALQQVKMPHSSFKISAKTAFIAQNQQVNEYNN